MGKGEYDHKRVAERLVVKQHGKAPVVFERHLVQNHDLQGIPRQVPANGGRQAPANGGRQAPANGGRQDPERRALGGQQQYQAAQSPRGGGGRQVAPPAAQKAPAPPPRKGNGIPAPAPKKVEMQRGRALEGERMGGQGMTGKPGQGQGGYMRHAHGQYMHYIAQRPDGAHLEYERVTHESHMRRV